MSDNDDSDGPPALVPRGAARQKTGDSKSKQVDDSDASDDMPELLNRERSVDSSDDSDGPPGLMGVGSDSDDSSEPPALMENSSSDDGDSVPPLHPRGSGPPPGTRPRSSLQQSAPPPPAPPPPPPKPQPPKNRSERRQEQQRLRREQKARKRNQTDMSQVAEREAQAAAADLERARLARVAAEEAAAARARQVQEAIKAKAAQILKSAMQQYAGRRSAERRIANVVALQAGARFFEICQRHGSDLRQRLERARRFRKIWAHVFGLAKGSTVTTSWTSMKEKLLDIVANNEFNQIIGMALESAAGESNDSEEEAEVDVKDDNEEEEQAPDVVVADHDSSNAQELAQSGIRYTSFVDKWVRHADKKFRGFFFRRMKQLAEGENKRSRILAKGLVGCKSRIFETYLEQKSGMRILWIEDEHRKPVIYYVAKHDQVSAFVKLMDRAEARTNRQLLNFSNVSESMLQDGSYAKMIDNAVREQIRVDPMGNTPLKLYEVKTVEIENMANESWKPRLSLTSEERDIVETDGTVLLLGRSGTGKTVCIAARMTSDRQRNDETTLSQLFVARSNRLGEFVKKIVGETPTTTFTTFGNLLDMLEHHPRLTVLRQGVSNNRANRMDYSRFKREVFQRDKADGMDALVIWTNIRSFIKGSIEALKDPNRACLTEQEFLDLGKHRCRLPTDQRVKVYKWFETYQKFMRDSELFDDCDRVYAIVRRLQELRMQNRAQYDEATFRKCYVDEVQDYTQSEILLFYLLSGPKDLFLAGDPAQAVAEGVEFRFDEIRSVAWYFSNENPDLVPDKPKIVSLNMRSHAGVLNVAGAVLERLFKAYPDSAKQLKEDRGLFQGPRPAVFQQLDPPSLKELLMKGNALNGVNVLTHDSDKSKWQELLDYPLVYGIAEAKGLEFKSLMILDFFADLPADLQVPMRELLLGREPPEFADKYPEIEWQLKLLYTAVTRCINQLLFVETERSVAGGAFVRWATTNTVKGINRRETLAVSSNRENIEITEKLPDEWRSDGLDAGAAAESAEDLQQADAFLDRAIYSFQQMEDAELLRKAQVFRASLRFRFKLEDLTSAKDVDEGQLEVDAANIVKGLLSDSFQVEARHLCESVLGRLNSYTRGRLQNELLDLLQLPAN